MAQTVKHLPTMRETRVQFLGWEDLLEKEIAIHFSILAWKIPWTEKPSRLQSMGLQRVGHDWGTSLSLFLGGSNSKESACNVGDPGLIPVLRRSPWEENGYPLQYSCLENPMGQSPWQRRVGYNWVTTTFTSTLIYIKPLWVFTVREIYSSIL